MKIKIFQILKITLGIILMSIGYYFFLEPSGLITGGIMGLALVVKDFIPFSPAIFMYIVNGLLLILSLFLLGKESTLKTIYASILSPTIILIFELTCESDILLKGVNPSNWYLICSIASSVLVGLGLGICFRNNSTTGGMDIIQKILNKYFHISYSKSMHYTDAIIILISGFIVNKGGSVYGIEAVLFGFVGVILIGYIVDYIALGGKLRRTVYVITSKPNEIKEMIYKKIDRGVTLCPVKGGYTNDDLIMVICTMDEFETYKIKKLIFDIDPEAFTFISQAKEVIGDYK